MNRKSLALGMLIPFAAATLVATAPAASAKSVVAKASGKCSGTSHWKMKAKPDDGRMEVEFEVDSNRNGQRWTVRINDNGHRVFTGSRLTHAPSGSFSLERRFANRPGKDRFVAVAKNPRTGETCIARVTR
jgi:hypothetical protein